MSTLVAIAYPDQATADDVVATLGRLQTEHLIALEDAVVVTRDDKGKVKLHQTQQARGRRAPPAARCGAA